jgi:hypothetical protein
VQVGDIQSWYIPAPHYRRSIMHEIMKDKHWKALFKKMCSYNKVPLKFVGCCDDWYRKYTWTQDQHDDYKKWWIDYVYKNRKHFGVKYATKKAIVARFEWFNLMWGWKIK